VEGSILFDTTLYLFEKEYIMDLKDTKMLKQALKPVVKELIYECLITEGILSSVVTEVMKGARVAPIVESKQQTQPQSAKQITKPRLETDDEAAARKKKLQEALGSKLGINVFEGTTPLPSGGIQGDSSPTQAAAGNPLSGLDPNDSGVDISGLLKLTGGWRKI
jgi:hypothetical protein